MYNDRRTDKFTQCWNFGIWDTTHRWHLYGNVRFDALNSINWYLNFTRNHWLDANDFLFFSFLIDQHWFSHPNDLRNAYMIFLFQSTVTKIDGQKMVKIKQSKYLKLIRIWKSINSFFHLSVSQLFCTCSEVVWKEEIEIESVNEWEREINPIKNEKRTTTNRQTKSWIITCVQFSVWCENDFLVFSKWIW